MKFGKGVLNKISKLHCDSIPFHPFRIGESTTNGVGSILNGKFTVDSGRGFHSIERFLVKFDGSGINKQPTPNPKRPN